MLRITNLHLLLIMSGEWRLGNFGEVNIYNYFQNYSIDRRKRSDTIADVGRNEVGSYGLAQFSFHPPFGVSYFQDDFS